MIQKQDFCNAIRTIQNITDYQADRNKLYRKYDVDGFLIEPDAVETVIRLLGLFFEDTDISAIKTFCLDQNFGRGKGNKYYMDEEGQKKVIETPEDLFDYLSSLREQVVCQNE